MCSTTSAYSLTGPPARPDCPSPSHPRTSIQFFGWLDCTSRKGKINWLESDNAALADQPYGKGNDALVCHCFPLAGRRHRVLARYIGVRAEYGVATQEP